MNASMKFLRLALCLTIFCVASFTDVNAQQAKRGPSTEQERKRMVTLITLLENNPLDKDAKAYRGEVIRWLTDVPDISVTICPDLLPGLLESKKKYAGDLFLQSTFSTAKFIIEHMDQAKDDLSVNTAGVEGTLRAYAALQKQKPDVRFSMLDDLADKQKKGTLQDYMKAATGKCNRPKEQVK